MIYVKAKDLRVGDRIYVNSGGPYRIEEVAVGTVNVAVRILGIKNIPLWRHSLDTELLIADREPPYPGADRGWVPGVNYEWDTYVAGQRQKVRAVFVDDSHVVRVRGEWCHNTDEATFELASKMGTALVAQKMYSESTSPAPTWHIRYKRQFGIVSASLVRDHTAVRTGPWATSDESALDGLAQVIGKYLDKR
jgi:hypothetical protein